jgi:hypothetical protein
MMFLRTILSRHEHRATRTAVANLQAKDVAVKGDRTLHVTNVNTDVTE